jgi:hypothetical protein
MEEEVKADRMRQQELTMAEIGGPKRGDIPIPDIQEYVRKAS